MIKVCLKHSTAKSVSNSRIYQIKPKDLIKVVKRVRGGYLCEYSGIRVTIEKDIIKNNFRGGKTWYIQIT